MKYAFLVTLLLFIAGCFSSEEPDPELVKLFGNYCESLGHKKGTPEFNECVTKIGQKK